MTLDAVLAPAHSASLGRHYLRLLACLTDWCGTVFDPRPDLAIPARRVRLAYFWWW